MVWLVTQVTNQLRKEVALFDGKSNIPIYIQIATMIEDMIINGELREDEQLPSTNQLANLYKLNPATARKGLNILVDEGLAYKKRGLGIYVAKGAVNKLKNKRKKDFLASYIKPLVEEAIKLEISREEIKDFIDEVTKNA